LDPDAIWGGVGSVEGWWGPRFKVKEWFREFLVPISLNGVFFKRKCVRLVREKFRIFQYGQYTPIVGNVCLLVFGRNSPVRDRCWVYKKCAKCNSHFTPESCQAATPSSNLLREVNVVRAMIASWPGAHLFCAVWLFWLVCGQM